MPSTNDGGLRIRVDPNVSLETLLKVGGIIIMLTLGAWRIEYRANTQDQRISEVMQEQSKRYGEIVKIMDEHTKAMNRIELYLASKDPQYWRIVREFPEPVPMLQPDDSKKQGEKP